MKHVLNFALFAVCFGCLCLAGFLVVSAIAYSNPVFLILCALPSTIFVGGLDCLVNSDPV